MFFQSSKAWFMGKMLESLIDGINHTQLVKWKVVSILLTGPVQTSDIRKKIIFKHKWKFRAFNTWKKSHYYGWKEMFFPKLFNVFTNRTLGKVYSVKQNALGTLTLQKKCQGLNFILVSKANVYFYAKFTLISGK